MEENTGFTLKQLAEEDRPREKLLLKGRQSLTNAELIAILIGSGNTKETAVELAQRILVHYRNNLDLLGRLGIDDFEISRHRACKSNYHNCGAGIRPTAKSCRS